MRVLRPFAWAAVLVAAFLYITSVAHWNVGRLLEPVRNTGRVWSEPAATSAAGGYSADEQNNMDVYKSAHDATVNITSIVYREDFFFGVYQGEGAGSGFIINPDGTILTNNHVVNGTAQLTVTLSDKKTFKAKVLVTDRRNDLALIKIEAPRKLVALKLGDSDVLAVGQKVLAIGNPFGFGGTLTTGVVSSLDRTIQTEENRNLEGMIQTDAAINPGNSGGPLLDSHGSVIGINTAIYGQQGNIGLGFAMPINRAKGMMEQQQGGGRVSRAAPLGIRTVYIPGDLADQLNLGNQGGLLIQTVDRGSTSEEFGLRGRSRMVLVGNYQLGIGGDLIVAVEGQPVEGTDSLTRVMARKHGGETLNLTIVRGGQKMDVKLKLGEAPTQL